MARNLQSKLKPSDKVAIFDVNPTALESLSAEMKAASSGAAVEVAASAYDASKEAVSHCQCLFHVCSRLLWSIEVVRLHGFCRLLHVGYCNAALGYRNTAYSPLILNNVTAHHCCLLFTSCCFHFLRYYKLHVP